MSMPRSSERSPGASPEASVAGRRAHALILRATAFALFASAVALISPDAGADVIPPGVREAEQRLRDNPKAFDRVDQFCAGRAIGAACSIPGDALSGGGAGICRNGLDATRTHIDLKCQRRATVTIDRGLPSGGYTLPAHVCADPEGAEVARREGHGCARPAQPLQDRFCAGLAVGTVCEATLVVDGKAVRNKGVCARVTEPAPRFYFRGWQVAQREVLQCVSAKPVVHDLKPLSWWQKVRQ